jgi:hypothetical protein
MTAIADKAIAVTESLLELYKVRRDLLEALKVKPSDLEKRIFLNNNRLEIRSKLLELTTLDWPE